MPWRRRAANGHGRCRRLSGLTNNPASLEQSKPDRHFLGMPLALLGGYIAIVFCMTGDGIEQAFLSKYLVTLGFSPARSALVFTVYGATAAFSSWLSGVLADVFNPRRIMLIGVVWWVLFHILFLLFGLSSGSLLMTMLFYGMRGFAYPLFFYGFFVWVVQRSRPHELASAIGWTWSMFTTATLAFFWLPIHYPHNTFVASVAALFFAFTITSFVPMGAIFPMIEPEHKGAAVSVQNLGGGLANLCGPMLAALILPFWGIGGVVIVYGVLYYAAAVLTLFIVVEQPRGSSALQSLSR
jgi:predicted MFS family arabinose efflux permease